ncbi:MAG: extracellular solute-binding protein [Chloroflexi bacterium]|nr:extracellular solute-binding protein [Chloroflexota bacterium]
MVKIVSITIAVVVTALVLVACAQGTAPPTVATAPAAGPVRSERTAWEADWEKTVAAAKKEGKVMVYSTASVALLRELGRVFNNKYGIEVEALSGRGEDLTRRMETEKRAGLNLFDVTLSGGTTILLSMKPLGLLDKLEPLLVLPEVTDAGAWVAGSVPFMDKDRVGLGMLAVFQRYIVRNTDMVKEGEVTSYKDLVNSRWKGKMSLNDPTVSGSGNALFTKLAHDIWNLEETLPYMRQIVSQEPAISRDKRQVPEWVARGKYALALAPDRESAVDFMTAGAPVAYVKMKEGSTIGTAGGGLAVAAVRPHPNATKVFVNWLLSKEGHAVFIGDGGQPGARKDAPREGVPPLLFAEPGEKVYLETEEAVLFRGEMLKHAREIFGPLVR